MPRLICLTVLALLAAAASDRAVLSARPVPVAPVVTHQSETLELPGGAHAFIPAGIDTSRSRPALLVILHGTGGRGVHMMQAFRPFAEHRKVVLLAPQVARYNWERASARPVHPNEPLRFGVDSARIDRGLAALFARISVDPGRIGLIGYSSGAGYALSLGMANPQLFGTLIALSPGYAAFPARGAKQRIVVVHGERDQTLPFRRTRDAIVPRLRSEGHQITFVPFKGGHELNAEAMDKALRIFLEANAGPAWTLPSTRKLD